MRSKWACAVVLVWASWALATDITLEAGGTGGETTTPFRTYLRGGIQASDLTWTFPDNCGSDGDRLTTSGACVLTWTPSRAGATVEALTNKTIDGASNDLQVRRHATDCTALTDGVTGEPCYEQDADAIYVCEPTAGACDTAAEWRATGSAGSGDVTDVWGCQSGNCDALTAASGDTLDAALADSAKPCTRSATLPGTCAEGDCAQDTDSGGSETHICTATNTWTKLGTAPAITLDIGDDGGNDSVALTEFATVRDDTTIVTESSADKLLFDAAKVKPLAFGQVAFMGDTTCGTATSYMSPFGTCNATETSADFPVHGAVTLVGLACTQIQDTTCTMVFTVRDDAVSTAATCTTTNADTCNWSGSVAVAEDSLVAVMAVDSTGCTDGSRMECVLTFTY